MPTPQGDTLTVFVVDDDPAVRDSLETMLGAAGYRCAMFASGAEFLASDPGAARGCVLVDVRMPGMDGLELQRQMKARAVGLPVIFMTGFGEVPLAVEAMKAGAVDFVEKPSTLAVLLERNVMAVVGTCGADEALAMVRERHPEVVVVDVPGRERPILSYLPHLTSLRPAPRVVCVCRDPSRADVTAALALGVDACVSEQAGSAQLLAALEAVRRAEKYIAPDVLDASTPDSRLPADGAGRNDGAAGDPPGGPVHLTPRERDVLRLIAQGKTEHEIGRELGVSPKTVHTHRTSIMSKLDVHNGIALVRRAIRLGLAEP